MCLLSIGRARRRGKKSERDEPHQRAKAEGSKRLELAQGPSSGARGWARHVNAAAPGAECRGFSGAPRRLHMACLSSALAALHHPLSHGISGRSRSAACLSLAAARSAGASAGTAGGRHRCSSSGDHTACTRRARSQGCRCCALGAERRMAQGTWQERERAQRGAESCEWAHQGRTSRGAEPRHRRTKPTQRSSRRSQTSSAG